MAQVNNVEIFNEINTPLRFYDDELKRNEYKRYCKGECSYKLLALPRTLLPFMISRDYLIGGADAFTIKPEGSSSGSWINLSTSLITKRTILTKDYLIYNGDDIGQELPCGFYYIEVASAGRTYYSERIFVVPHSYCGNIAINPRFAIALTGWAYSGGVEWSGYGAHFIGGGGGTFIQQEVTHNTKIRVKVNVAWYNTLSNITLFIDGSANSFSPTSGVHTFIGDSGSTGMITLSSIGTFDGYIQSIEVETISVEATDCNIGLEWYSDCDFGDMYYGSGFRNRFYLPADCQLSEPSYRIIKEGIEDGYGKLIEKVVKREKVYRLELGLCPEFVVDALVDMQIHPLKYIHLPLCFGSAEISDVTVKPTWQFSGCNATVEIEFTIGNIVETGCCGDMTHCYEPCADVIFNYEGEPSTRVEGKIYLDKSIQKLVKITNGVPIIYPCPSGYATRSEDDIGSCPAGWRNENGIWQEIPRVFSSEKQSISGNYLIKAIIMEGSKGILEISCDGGDTWNVIGSEMNTSDWINVGQEIELPASDCLVRIVCYSNECTYGSSCSFYGCGVKCISEYPLLSSMITETSFSEWDSWDVSITSIEIESVETLSAPVDFSFTPDDIVYGMCSDGIPRMTNIQDVIQGLLPYGYRFEEDGRVLRYPCGYGMVIRVSVTYNPINSEPRTDEYVYVTDEGKVYINGEVVTSYSCY